MCWNKGRLCWKIAKLFYFCHLKKLVSPETFGPHYVSPKYFGTNIKHLYEMNLLHWNAINKGNSSERITLQIIFYHWKFVLKFAFRSPLKLVHLNRNVKDKHLTLILLSWTIWRVPTNVSKWRMGFNSAFKVLTLILLSRTIWRVPTNFSKWRMGFNSTFKGLIFIYS